MDKIKISYKNQQNLYSSNDIIITICLGVLWGVIEVFLSPLLKGFRLPLSGVILTAIAIIIILTRRYFAQSPGTILFMGLIAALIKFFSQSTIVCYPAFAIMIEATIAEVVFLILRIRLISYITTGILLLLYVSFHSIFTKGFSIQQWSNITDAPIFNRIAHTLEIDPNLQAWIILFFFATHMLIGIIAALFAWILSKFLSQRFKKNKNY